MRLTTDCPVSHILEERTFRLEQPIALFLGPDEGFDADIGSTCERMLRETTAYWMTWVRGLAIPLEWQDGGDPRRHHPEALRARGNRRDRRGDDHLDPRTFRQPAATGTIATAGCATPTTWSRPSTGWAPWTSWRTIWAICATSSIDAARAATSSRCIGVGWSRS
jgi:hypothetical protein